MKNPAVLFVEDEQFHQKLYGDAMVEAGFKLSIAKNGEEALAFLERQSFDVVVLDLIMPLMSGQRFLEEAKKHKTPIIVLTTLEGDTDRQDALNAGAKHFLTKSDTSPDKLVDVVKKIS